MTKWRNTTCTAYMEWAYTLFRTIDSHQDTEVLMDGKKSDVGSNAYTGLTYDKRINEAAKAATDNTVWLCRFPLLNGTLIYM
jgi:8-amino-7-oxononanoate synthase